MSWWGSNQRTIGLRTKPSSASVDGRGGLGAGLSSASGGVPATADMFAPAVRETEPARRSPRYVVMPVNCPPVMFSVWPCT